MNEQPLYELQIASKLEQLPVPDMADAIWTRIKDQLDTDMPTGGQNPPPPPTRPRSAGQGKMGLLGIIIASIVLIYFITPKKQNKILPSLPQQSQNDSATRIYIPPSGTHAQLPPVKKVGSPLKIPTGQQHHDSLLPAPKQIIPPPNRLDSAAAMPLAPANNDAPLVQPSVPSATIIKDSALQKKKPRGVRGISDGDYKIVPKTQR